VEADATPDRPAPGFWRRLGGGLRWLTPGAGLLLVPKCPACLAGYIALSTGVGVTLPVAKALRIVLLVACVGCLAWLAGNALRRRWSKGSD
jgi:hypothetical protein